MDWTLPEIIDLIRARHQFGRMEGFYVCMDDWNQSPLTARIHAFSFEDAEEFDDVAGVPLVASVKGLQTLLVINNLEDVVLNTLARDSRADLSEHVLAIDYYRELDSFRA